MQANNSYEAIFQKVLSGEVGMHELPSEWDEVQKAHLRKEVIACKLQNHSMLHDFQMGDVINQAHGKNCENIVGTLQVPMGVVGPISIGDTLSYVPLATTEGALVASVQRGSKALSLSRKMQFYLDDKGMTRAPVFVVDDSSTASKVMAWLSKKENLGEMQALSQGESSHLKLLKVRSKLVGRNLFIKFFFDTGAAMGMNMVTLAVEKISFYLEKKFEISCVSLSGNGCVDKKPSWGSVLEGRGFYIQAEAVIPTEILELVLKTQAQKIVEVSLRKNYIGGAAFGSMGFNAHYANMVAAFYLATGQDMAHVVEGSVGITTAEQTSDGLYFSVTLPNVLVGVVGGGTGLPCQKQALTLMGITEATHKNKRLLAQHLAYVVMAGELSLLAALASKSLAFAHAKYGRGKSLEVGV